jgi:hypothetical protein
VRNELIKFPLYFIKSKLACNNEYKRYPPHAYIHIYIYIINKVYSLIGSTILWLNCIFKLNCKKYLVLMCILKKFIVRKRKKKKKKKKKKKITCKIIKVGRIKYKIFKYLVKF